MHAVVGWGWNCREVRYVGLCHRDARRHYGGVLVCVVRSESTRPTFLSVCAAGSAERLGSAIKLGQRSSTEAAALTVDAEHCCVMFSPELPKGFRVGCCSRCTAPTAASQGQACVPLSRIEHA